MIWIIGGTSEAKELVKKLKGRKDFIVTAATEAEREFIDCENLQIGRLNFYDMVKFVEENSIELIIDLSHPYAKIVSQNAKKVSEGKNIRYVRYIRNKTNIPNYAVYMQNLKKTLEYLREIEGTVFFTTGSKSIGDFEEVRGNNRFIYRILPTPSSIKECNKHNVHIKDIVAILGPFSEELNFVMFKEYNADFVVMKDSGEKSR